MNLTPQQLSDLRWLASHPGATLIQFCNAKGIRPREAAQRLANFVLSGLVEVGEGQDMPYFVTDTTRKLYLERG